MPQFCTFQVKSGVPQLQLCHGTVIKGDLGYIVSLLSSAYSRFGCGNILKLLLQGQVYLSEFHNDIFALFLKPELCLLRFYLDLSVFCQQGTTCKDRKFQLESHFEYLSIIIIMECFADLVI